MEINEYATNSNYLNYSNSNKFNLFVSERVVRCDRVNDIQQHINQQQNGLLEILDTISSNQIYSVVFYFGIS